MFYILPLVCCLNQNICFLALSKQKTEKKGIHRLNEIRLSYKRTKSFVCSHTQTHNIDIKVSVQLKAKIKTEVNLKQNETE